MRREDIERALMADDGALLGKVLAADRATDEQSEREETAVELPAFPELAWRGIFADYRECMAGTTEASDVAHFAAWWATSAVTLGRRIWMYSGDWIYPNVYIGLFGGTGDKKTTATRRPQSAGLLTGVKVIASVGSTEGLAGELQTESGSDAVVLFCWEELSSLLAHGRWKGSIILQFLTECFDCPSSWALHYRKNPIAVTLPTPSVLAGTTTDWFWKTAEPGDFFGGFGNRFVYLTGRKKSPIPNPSEPDGAKLAAIRAELGLLQNLSGRGAFEPAATRLWECFYCDFESAERSGLFGAATKRIHVYVRKLAMTYAALERTFPIVTLDQLKASIAVGLYAAECVRLLIDSRASARPEAEIEMRFAEWVRKHPGKRKRDMQQTMSKVCTCEIFNRVVLNLLRAGVIRLEGDRLYLGG